MHPVDALPPIAVSCTDYNELVFVIGFASAKNTARFLAQMVWLLRCCWRNRAGNGRSARIAAAITLSA